MGILVWTGMFLVLTVAGSVVAAAGQVVLSRTAILTPTLPGTSAVLSAALLILAGGFQFTSLKDACLTQCRSPWLFLLASGATASWVHSYSACSMAAIVWAAAGP